MTIAFTKGKNRTYAATVQRDDGVELRVPGYDRKYDLPHDIAHYIVERELGLQGGFWGPIAAGALFPGMTVVSGRQPPRAAARSKAILKEAGQQGTEAEVLVCALYEIMEKGVDQQWPVARTLLQDAWAPPDPACDPLTPETVQTVCQALREVQTQWQALPVGGSLTVRWTR